MKRRLNATNRLLWGDERIARVDQSPSWRAQAILAGGIVEQGEGAGANDEQRETDGPRYGRRLERG